jgi:threonyl-tRNA synthetase
MAEPAPVQPVENKQPVKAEQNAAKKEKPKRESQPAKKVAPKKVSGKTAKDFPAPDFVQKRLEMWEKLKASQAGNKPEGAPIKITLPDGKVVDGISFKTCPIEIAKSISSKLGSECIGAKVDGQSWDVTRPLEASCKLELFTFDSDYGKHVFWHSSAHILGLALERRYGAYLGVGPALDDGFYYDSSSDNVVSEEHYDEIQSIIDEVTKNKENFERLRVSKEDALEMFGHNKYKRELIGKIPDGDALTLYKCGPFIDLCRGPHLPDTARVKAFKITKVTMQKS